ncbi:MAG: sulfatase [Sedimentisphaerales bacterium]|nr:sulfatase [Sedimentisphaerales bacterium]
MNKLRLRWGTMVKKVAWFITVLLILSVILANYYAYKKQHLVITEFPKLEPAKFKNTILITLDTLRADFLGCYGNKTVQTPNLDALAKDGILFETTYSQSPHTTPSHCSIFTSVYASRHGSRNGSAMKPGFVTITEILKDNGFQTAAFVSASVVQSRHSGLHHGFDYYEDSITTCSSIFRHDELQFLLPVHYILHMQHHQIPGNIVSDRAIKWLNNQAQQPFFCWLHYYDPHTPYDAPEPYKNMYKGKLDPQLPIVHQRSRYAGEVTFTDYQVGRIMDTLKQNNLYNDMLIIVTADHGEAFGEKHDNDNITEYGHGKHLYDTTQKVPLIVKLPAQIRAGTRINDVVSLLDLAPTLLEYSGSRPPDSFQGKSILDLLNGENTDEMEKAFFERLDLAHIFPDSPILSQRLMALRDSDYKYFCSQDRKREELYCITSDPGETINLCSENPELARELYQQCKTVLGDPTSSKNSNITVDPHVLEQLKTLGYTE